MEEASMRFLLSIFCQSFTQAGFYYLMSLVVIHLSLAPSLNPFSRSSRSSSGRHSSSHSRHDRSVAKGVREGSRGRMTKPDEM